MFLPPSPILFLSPSLLFSSPFFYVFFPLLLCFLLPSSVDQESNQQLLQLCIILNKCHLKIININQTHVSKKNGTFFSFLEPREQKIELFFLFFQTQVSIRRKTEDPRTENGRGTENGELAMEEDEQMAN